MNDGMNGVRWRQAYEEGRLGAYSTAAIMLTDLKEVCDDPEELRIALTVYQRSLTEQMADAQRQVERAQRQLRATEGDDG